MLLDTLRAANKLCCGCGACYNACPVNAIDMRPNRQGFLYPAIDEQRCIKCGKCEHVCPKITPPPANTDKPRCYAARANDEIRRKSSSGGLFTLLAQAVLKQSGVVCGATMEDDYSVHHICIEHERALAKLQKSKYVQSNTEHIYQEISAFIKAKRLVLFTGTPCQVAAARNYFGAENEYVRYVDILCHGVPSVQMWQDYIKESFDLTQLKTVEFRSKLNGWRAEQLRAFWKDGTSTRIPWADSAYEEGFQRNICLRDGCENCEFCGQSRQGDLTIGDFWRVEMHDPKLNDHKGTSVLLVNNERGEHLLDEIKGELLDLTATPIEAARFNRLKTTFASHPMKARFKTLYPGHRFTDAVMQCRHALYDVGLIGNYLIGNYGGHLTQYALYCTLTSMGYSVLMIERPWDAPEPPRRTVANIFATPPYPSYATGKIYANIAEMKFFNRQCQVFVTGSDQMFNNNLFNLYGKIMVQNFVQDNHPKIAYAASFGHANIWGPEIDRAAESFFMKRFDAFSVREDSAVALCEREFGIKATWVLDPVFLCPMEEYHRLVQAGSKALPDKPFMFAYILDPSKEKEQALNHYAHSHNLVLRAIADLWHPPAKVKAAWSVETLFGVKIEGWLAHIAKSSFFITDSFHGMCFAILFKKQFIVLVNKERGETRFTSLTGLLGLRERLAYTFEEAKEKMAQLPPINYEAVYAKLDTERKRCREWLRNAIETHRNQKKPLSTFDMLDARCDDLCLRFDRKIDEQQKTIQQLQEALTKLLESQPVIQPPPPPPPKESRFRWAYKKVKSGIQCYKDNGFRYTQKRFLEKVRARLTHS